eukprot:UN07002
MNAGSTKRKREKLSLDQEKEEKEVELFTDTLGYEGVFWDTENKKFRAECDSKMLGFYENLEKAASAVNWYSCNHLKIQKPNRDLGLTKPKQIIPIPKPPKKSEDPTTNSPLPVENLSDDIKKVETQTTKT